jgi:hypothetical protein
MFELAASTVLTPTILVAKLFAVNVNVSGEYSVVPIKSPTGNTRTIFAVVLIALLKKPVPSVTTIAVDEGVPETAAAAGLFSVKSKLPSLRIPDVNVRIPVAGSDLVACNITPPLPFIVRFTGPFAAGHSALVDVSEVVFA